VAVLPPQPTTPQAFLIAKSPIFKGTGVRVEPYTPPKARQVFFRNLKAHDPTLPYTLPILLILGVISVPYFLSVKIPTMWRNYWTAHAIVERHESALKDYIAASTQSSERFTFRPLGRLIVVSLQSQNVAFIGDRVEGLMTDLWFRNFEEWAPWIAESPGQVNTLVLLKRTEQPLTGYERVGIIPSGRVATGYRLDMEVDLIDLAKREITWRRRFRGGAPPQSAPGLSDKIYGDSPERRVTVYLQDLARASDVDTVAQVEAYWSAIDELYQTNRALNEPPSFWDRSYGGRVTRDGDDFRVTGFTMIQDGWTEAFVPYTAQVRYVQAGTWKVPDIQINRNKRSR
jgi:hypothetical protein